MGGAERTKRWEDVESERDLDPSISTLQRLPTRKSLRPKGTLPPRRSRSHWSAHARVRPLLVLREEDPQLQLHPRRGPHAPALVRSGPKRRVPDQEQGPERGRGDGPFLDHLRQHTLQTHNQPSGSIRLGSISAHSASN